MKLITMLLIMAFLITRCGSTELTKDEAIQLLKKEKPYPRVVDYDVYCADLQHATRLFEKGFESNGLVTIQKTQKIIDIGKPLITFSEKSKEYLLPTPEEDLQHQVQKVKIADEEIEEVKAIKWDKNTNIAVVHYTTVYKNATPFAEATPFDMKKIHDYTATFVLTDSKWVMEKRKR